MSPAAGIPLTLAVAVDSWTMDGVALVLVVLVGAGYARCYRAARAVEATGRAQAWCFAVGLGLWALATLSVIAVYAPVLFWMRALQVLMLLFVVPFFLALGRPVTTVRAALTEPGRQRLDGALASRFARLALAPPSTSVAMLAVPWLLYLTPWYVASMTGPVGAATRVLLVLIGFGYFYARLQSDPVPRRYSPLLSIGISAVETLGDGLLGLVLWLGPLIAAEYYAGLHRNWGPSARTDQTVGAGILWILGDVLGVPFLLVLMRTLATHEKVRARDVDTELDRAGEQVAERADEARPALWWEADPQLRERFGRS
jgi:cytochrome c oxidase assembly factor CtaG